MENNFGTNLRLLRKKKKLTLETLGETLKISKSAISDYEIGKTFPPLDVCVLISDYFEINIDVLKNATFKDLSDQQIAELISQKPKTSEETENDLSSERKQLAFHNKLLAQQVDGLKIQLQLVNQLVLSKASEIKSLQIQVRLLEEKLNG